MIFTAGCGTAAPTATVVEAPYIKTAVKVDGSTTEKVWKDQSYTNITGQDGKTVKIKAAYSEKGLSLLIRWPDETKDDHAPVWEFDGQAWRKTGFQDEMAIFWDVDNSIAGFNTKGCAVLCHEKSGAEYMATNGRQEIADTWIWTAGISNPYNYALDGKLDDTVIQGNNMAAFKPKPGDTGFVVNENEGAPPQVERRPLSKLKNGLTVENTPYPTRSQMESIKSYDAFAAGAREPTIYFTGPPAGDIGDVSAASVWKDGYWTMEVTRKLDTGQSSDVKFLPASERSIYVIFALSIFENDGEDKTHAVYDPASIRLTPR